MQRRHSRPIHPDRRPTKLSRPHRAISRRSPIQARNPPNHTREAARWTGLVWRPPWRTTGSSHNCRITFAARPPSCSMSFRDVLWREAGSIGWGEIDARVEHAVEELLKRSRSLFIASARFQTARCEVTAKHRAQRLKVTGTPADFAASRIPASSKARVHQGAHRRFHLPPSDFRFELAPNSSNAARPAAIASGLPLNVPAWYTGPSGAR